MPAAAVLAVALAARLVVVAQLADSPTFEIPIVDAEVYDRIARSLAAGDGLGEAFFYQPFLFPFLLSLVYRVTGASIVAAYVAQAVVGAATCAVTYVVGERLLDRRTGVVAGLATAFYGPLVLFDTQLLATSLAAFWSIALVGMFSFAPRGRTMWPHVAVGVSSGLAVLTRPTFLPFVLAASAWLGWTIWTTDRNRALRSVAAVVVGFAVVAVPVAALGSHHAGRFTPLPASGGLNLHLGNNPDPCATLTIRPGREWNQLVSAPAEAGSPGLWGGHRYYLDQVLGFARHQPVSFVAGLATKTVQIVSSREIPRNVDGYLLRRWSALLSVLMWRVGGFGFPFGVLLPLAVTGLVLRWRSLPPPVTLFLLLYPAAVVLVFVSSRYRTPVVPVLALVAAAGVSSLAERAWSRRHGIAAVAAALALVIAVVPGPFCQEEDLEGEYWFLVGAGHLRNGDRQAAIEALETAATLAPEDFETQFTLGSLLLEKNEFQPAAEAFRRAVAADPGSAIARRDLGFALGRSGDLDAALRQLVLSEGIDPDDPRTQNSLGAVLFQMGRHRDALSHLERAVRLDPSYEPARANLEHVRSILAAEGGQP